MKNPRENSRTSALTECKQCTYRRHDGIDIEYTDREDILCCACGRLGWPVEGTYGEWREHSHAAFAFAFAVRLCDESRRH